MAGENEVDIKFGANIDDVTSKTAEVAKSVQSSASDISSGFDAVANDIKSSFASVADVIGSVRDDLSSFADSVSSTIGDAADSVGVMATSASDAIHSVIVSIQQMIDKLVAAASYTYTNATEIGAGFVGLGLIAKKIFLSIGSDIGKSIATPFALAAAGVASFGVMLLTLVGYVYLVVKAVELLWDVLTGKAFHNAAIDALEKEKQGYESLANQLGVTTTQAQGLTAAFERLANSKTAASGDAIKDAGSRLKELSNDDDGKKSLVSLGVINPQLKTQYELIVQVADALEAMTDAKKRQAAADSLNITSADAYIAVVRETQAALVVASDEQKAYSLVLGADGVAALDAYSAATREFAHNGSLTMQGFNRVLSDATMPILTDLANYFKDGLPNAVAAFRVLVSTLTALVQGLILSVSASLEAMLGAVKAIMNIFIGVGTVLTALAHGEFKLAWEFIKISGNNAATELSASFDRIMDKVKATNAAIKLAVEGGGGGGQAKPPPVKPASLFKPKKEDDTTDDSKKSDIPYYEAQYAAKKLLFEKTNNLREVSKEQERAYWVQVLDFIKNNEHDRIAVQKRIDTIELAGLKDKANKLRAVYDEDVNEAEKIELDKLRTKTDSNNQDLVMHRINAAEHLKIEMSLENEKTSIQTYYQQLRAQAIVNDPNSSPAALQQAKDKILDIERNNAQAISAIKRKQEIDDQQYMTMFYSETKNAFTSSLANMLNGTQRFTTAMRGLFQALGTSITNIFAKWVVDWVVDHAKMESISKAFSAMKIALIGAETTASVVGEEEAATAKEPGILMDIFSAAVRAAGSVADIPFVGWAMAAGVFAGTLAMLKGSMPSHDTGEWHVPNDHVAMIHKDETVLPKNQAEQFRAGGMGGATNINISAVDAHSVKRLFMDHGPALVDSLKRQNRNFNMGST